MSPLARRTFAALKFRNYRLYLAAQLVSFSGTWMQSLAQSWLVLQLTDSGTALGTVLAMQFVPTLLFSPLGGTIADRLDKRKLIIGTQLFAGSLALLLGVLTLTGDVRLWMVYVIAAGFGLNTAVDNPARNVFVMEMVGSEHIANAVTLNSVMVNAARAVGPAIGGVLIATLGVGECFIVNAASYLVVVVALMFIDGKRLYPAARAPREKGQLRQGMAYAWNTPILRTTIVMLTLVGLFFFEFNVTFPLLAKHTFEVGSSGLAVFETLFGLGAVVGGLAVAALGQPTARRMVLLAASGGVAILMLAAAPTVLVAYAAVPLVGAAGIGLISVANAMLQLNSEPQLRGRVMALFAMAIMGMTPIGAPIVGWVGEHVDPRAALVVGGVSALAAAAFGWTQLHERAASPVASTGKHIAISPVGGD